MRHRIWLVAGSMTRPDLSAASARIEFPMVDADVQSPVRATAGEKRLDGAGPGFTAEGAQQSGCLGHWHHPGKRGRIRSYDQRLDVDSSQGQRETRSAEIPPLSGSRIVSVCQATPYTIHTIRYTIMLTGSELLAKVKELGDSSKSALVRECGYVSTKKDGSERLNFTAFYEALLEAKGLSLGSDGVGRGKGGRKLSYVATVQGNGNLLVGKAYTAMLDLEPGDEFEIKLGRKQIKLIPAGAAEEDDTAAAA
jgi:hypothetical protein